VSASHTRDPLASDGSPIDPLTGFGARLSLLAALSEAVEPGAPPALFVVFGLDGFDEYAALFGRLAARTLLVRLAARLTEALAPAGRCYRPRYDEFSALINTTITEARSVLDAAAVALRERGKAVTITAAWGAAMLPDEASDPVSALRLADERLSSNAPRRKRRNRRGAGPR
jgi:GGDEF domain-containing protein